MSNERMAGERPAAKAAHRYRGGYPALRWLAKTDPDAALAVLHAMRDAACSYVSASPTSQPKIEVTPDDAGPHAVPDAPVTSETMGGSAAARSTEMHEERLHEIRPDVNLMIADALRVRVTRFADGSIHRHAGFTDGPSFSGDLAVLAGMTFSFASKLVRSEVGGTMISYTDANNCRQVPQIIATKPKGGKRPHRTVASVAAYLDIPPVPASPLTARGFTRPMSGERALPDLYDPLPREEPKDGKAGRFGVVEARALLQLMGVHGAVPFDAARAAAGLAASQKAPTAIARGAHFIAGICGTKQTASSPAPLWQERETSFDPVIDEVAARGNLTSVGTRLGYRGGYADRAGKKALLATGRALVAANQNQPLKKIAA